MPLVPPRPSQRQPSNPDLDIEVARHDAVQEDHARRLGVIEVEIAEWRRRAYESIRAKEARLWAGLFKVALALGGGLLGWVTHYLLK